MAFDQPWEYKTDHFKGPGYMFLPLADGIFEAQLKDFNDVQYIGEHMDDTIGPLFYGMSYSERLAIAQANHLIHLGRELESMRSSDPAYDGEIDEPFIDLNCFPDESTP